MSHINQVLAKVSRAVQHLDPTDYGILAACAVLLGFMCMRGYGSRRNW